MTKAAQAHMTPELLASVLAHVQAMLQRGTLLPLQRMHCYEMLVTASNRLPNPHDRLCLVQQILQPNIEAFQAEPSLRDPTQFLTAMGVIGTQEASTHRSWFTNLSTILSTVLAVVKRVHEGSIERHPHCAHLQRLPVSGEQPELHHMMPHAPLMQELLPPLLHLIHTLHSLWAPPLRDQLCANPSTSTVLAMAEGELKLKANMSNVTSPKPVLDAAAPACTYWSSWVTELRYLAYQLLGLGASSLALFENKGGSGQGWEQVAKTVCHELKYMEHRHLTFLLKHFIQPYLLHCPPPLLDHVLTPLLKKVCMHSYERVGLFWSNGDNAPDWVTMGSIIVGDSVDETTKELVAEKVARELARTYLQVLQDSMALSGDLAKAFVVHKKSKGKSLPNVPLSEAARQKQAFAASLGSYMLSPTHLGLPFALSVVGALSWADGPACRAAIKLSHKLLEVGHEKPVYHELIGRHMFESGVYLLLKAQPWSKGLEWDVLALLHEVYCLLVLGQSPTLLQTRAAQALKMRTPPPNIVPRCLSPRIVLMSLPGISPQAVEALELNMRKCVDLKKQKDMLRDLLRVCSGGSADGPLGVKRPKIVDLPQQIVFHRTNNQSYAPSIWDGAFEDSAVGADLARYFE
eukprot:CAMPEP_0185773392 /NCGR_PEP_ID=MMETSP1174-20130828/73410_1 /TAXON_ID=35687 /ORGANISM="Dictyocha speculum, Strain CCMP1381" /LENGTH=631 /DNA_ID=CAMNT_0028460069 /DNA_START=21 /DNA_END=1916 /DNA_ORIENTATION=-